MPQKGLREGMSVIPDSVCALLLAVTPLPLPVIYLNNANACLDYAVGAGGADEFDDAKFVVKQICPDW